MTTRASPFLAALAVALAACSASNGDEPGAAATHSAAAATDDSALADAATPAPATSSAAPRNGRTITLQGLGDLVVGKPPPSGSSFAERGAQISEECRTVSSPEFPGVYAITEGEGGPVRRITVGQHSDVRLVEVIGVGATEQAVRAAFPGFQSSPHKYGDAPAKYLTQPGADPRLRFEIGENGRVSLIHVGLMPQLGYVEGCA